MRRFLQRVPDYYHFTADKLSWNSSSNFEVPWRCRSGGIRHNSICTEFICLARTHEENGVLLVVIDQRLRRRPGSQNAGAMDSKPPIRLKSIS